MDSAGGRHPYIDVGTLVPWFSQLEDALEAARHLGQRVLVVHGRATCAGTRNLVEKTLQKEEIAEFVTSHFVVLASNADAAEPAVAALVAAAPRHEPTPVSLYLDNTGRLVHATAGGRPPAVFLNDMLEATRR